MLLCLIVVFVSCGLCFVFVRVLSLFVFCFCSWGGTAGVHLWRPQQVVVPVASPCLQQATTAFMSWSAKPSGTSGMNTLRGRLGGWVQSIYFGLRFTSGR